jgi:prepilin-type N-terminal cleavage/methylation domain-containing protein
MGWMGRFVRSGVRAPRAFTLIELLVVITIVLILVGLLMTALAKARKRRYEVLATKTVQDIANAAMLYSEWASGYPPDTGNARKDGSTSPFTPDEAGANAPSGSAGCVVDSIWRYMGQNITDAQSERKHREFLLIPSATMLILNGDDRIYQDPWGNPYQMDSIHVVTSKKGAATDYKDQTIEITRVGAPYKPGTDLKDWKKEVKVWSFGDPTEPGIGSGDARLAKEPYSHVDAFPTGDQDDEIVIRSW